jgi:hypothetical protein
MRHSALLLLLVAGCSTAPVADVMDYFSPGRLDKPQVTPYGGVCLQPNQGPPINAIPIGGPVPPLGAAPAAPPVFPGAVPATAPPPAFPATSLPPGSPLVPVAPPPGFQGLPPGAVPVRPTSSSPSDFNPSRPPGAVLSFPAIDTNSPR